MLPNVQCCGRCASSPEILPWCTCDWVTWPKHQHGARVPWLMFYKSPRGLCTTSVPIFPPCCMHSAWDYIPQLQLLPQTMNSCRDDSHLTNPRTLRKIQIKGGRKHGFDLLASSVCAGSMLVEDKREQHGSWFQASYSKRCVRLILEHVYLSFPESSTYLHAKCN